MRKHYLQKNLVSCNLQLYTISLVNECKNRGLTYIYKLQLPSYFLAIGTQVACQIIYIVKESMTRLIHTVLHLDASYFK